MKICSCMWAKYAVRILVSHSDSLPWSVHTQHTLGQQKPPLTQLPGLYWLTQSPRGHIWGWYLQTVALCWNAQSLQNGYRTAQPGRQSVNMPMHRGLLTQQQTVKLGNHQSPTKTFSTGAPQVCGLSPLRHSTVSGAPSTTGDSTIPKRRSWPSTSGIRMNTGSATHQGRRSGGGWLALNSLVHITPGKSHGLSTQTCWCRRQRSRSTS